MNGIRLTGWSLLCLVLACAASDPAAAIVGSAAGVPKAVDADVSAAAQARPSAERLKTAMDRIALGERRLAAGSEPEAAQAFLEALAAVENLALAHRRLGEIQARAGRLRQAVQSLDRSLQLDPTQTGLYQTLGVLYAGTNRPDGAIECFEIARGLDEINPVFLRRLSKLYRGSGRTADAIAALEAYREQTPADTGVWKELAEMRRETGDTAGMILALEQAVEADPSDTDLRYRLALACTETDDTTKALHHLLILVRDQKDANEAAKPGHASETLESAVPTTPAPPAPGGAEDTARASAAAPPTPDPVPAAPEPTEDPPPPAPAQREPAEAGLVPPATAGMNRVPGRETVERIIEAGQAILPIDPSARYVFYVFSQEGHRRKIAETVGLGPGLSPLCIAAVSSKPIPAVDAESVTRNMVAEAEQLGCRTDVILPLVVEGLVTLGKGREVFAAVLVDAGPWADDQTVARNSR